MDWIHLAQDRDKWRVLVNTRTFGAHLRGGVFLVSHDSLISTQLKFIEFTSMPCLTIGTSCGETAIVQSVKLWATGLMAKEFRFDFRQGQETFVFSSTSRLALRSTQRSVKRVLEAVLGNKAHRRESDHSPPSSVEVKNT
jgi:hypothetical protein